jgi:hypothetical protein
MKRAAFALALSGVLLLATWVQAPAAPARDIAEPSAVDIADADQAAQAVAPVARQIDDEAARLRQHLAERLPFTPPARDPFRFRADTKRTGSEPFSSKSVEKGSDPVGLKTPASPPIAVPVLIGVTEDMAAGVVTRTAILSMGDDMAMVKTGQAFSRFIVRSIGALSVELVDVTSPNRAVSTISIR